MRCPIFHLHSLHFSHHALIIKGSNRIPLIITPIHLSLFYNDEPDCYRNYTFKYHLFPFLI